MQSALLLYRCPITGWQVSDTNSLLIPDVATGEAFGTTQQDTRQVLPTTAHVLLGFACSRRNSAHLRNPQEMKGTRSENPFRKRSVITLIIVGVWSLFDRYGYFVYLAMHEHSYKAAEITKKSTLPPM